MRSFFLVLLTVAIAVASGAMAQRGPVPATAAEGDEIWFAPFPYGFPAAPFQEEFGSFDAAEAFASADGWEAASSHVDVVKFYSGWVVHVTPEQLKAAVDGLTSQGIAIAVELPPLRYDSVCGFGVEGFVADPVGLALDVIGRIHAAGGTVKYAAIGEPFTFASTVYKGPQACSWPVDRIAREVDAFVDAVKAKYPSLLVGDIENDHPSPEQLIGWLDAYRSVSGRHFDFFHLDPDWYLRSDWPYRAKLVEDAARSRGIPFGMLCYGNEATTTDLAWLASSLDHVARYEGEAGGAPEHTVFQSWHRHPRYVKPEAEVGTYAWLLDLHAQGAPSLSLTVPNAAGAGTKTASATLKDAAGANLAGKTVTFEARRKDGEGSFSPVTYNGRVPDGVTGAVVGFRVNTECNCDPEETRLLLETVNYAEVGSPQNRVPNGDFGRGLEGWFAWGPVTQQGSAVSVHATATDEAGLNSLVFPVTAGASYTITFDARLDGRATGAGYFTLIFLTSSEVGRVRLPFEPPPVSVTAVTGANGVATATFADLPRARWEFTASYQPTPDQWPAYAPAIRTEPGRPTISSMSFYDIPSTGSPPQLVVRGSHFFFDTVVRIDGVARPTTVVSEDELRVTLDPADTWRPGRRNVTVWTPPGGGGLSDAWTYEVKPVPGRILRTLPGVANDSASPPPKSILTGP